MTKPRRKSRCWGVVRYVPGRASPEEGTAFYGWCCDRADAVAVAEKWSRRYKQCIILVKSDLIWLDTDLL